MYLNGELKSARTVDAETIEFAYQSQARAIAVLDGPPAKLQIDGEDAAPQMAGPKTLLLPRGQHFVTVTTR